MEMYYPCIFRSFGSLDLTLAKGVLKVSCFHFYYYFLLTLHIKPHRDVKPFLLVCLSLKSFRFYDEKEEESEKLFEHQLLNGSTKDESPLTTELYLTSSDRSSLIGNRDGQEDTAAKLLKFNLRRSIYLNKKFFCWPLRALGSLFLIKVPNIY